MRKTPMGIAVIAVFFWIYVSQEQAYADGICRCQCQSSTMPNPYICGQTCTTNASSCSAFCNRNPEYIGVGFGAGSVSKVEIATPVSDCVEMHQNGQDENSAFFWHQICYGSRL